MREGQRCRPRGHFAPGALRSRAPAVKGRMANVIVVRSPDPRFKEILFVLREDALADPERGREELLRQAREAAGAYLRRELPARRRPPRALLLTGGFLAAAGLAAVLYALLGFAFFL